MLSQSRGVGHCVLSNHVEYWYHFHFGYAYHNFLPLRDWSPQMHPNCPKQITRSDLPGDYTLVSRCLEQFHFLLCSWYSRLWRMPHLSRCHLVCYLPVEGSCGTTHNRTSEQSSIAGSPADHELSAIGGVGTEGFLVPINGGASWETRTQGKGKRGWGQDFPSVVGSDITSRSKDLTGERYFENIFQ